MTLDQALAFGIIGGTIVLFVWGRLPYDLVALLALLAAVLAGVVPPEKAFSGFSDTIVIVVGSALVVSAAVSRSGFVEALMRPLLPRLTREGTQVPALTGATMLLSMVTKNVGALAIFMPVAFQLARRTGTAPSALLMPMAFASLLGGLVTLVGTSPNIIVSQLRADLLGKPFGMFDYAPVGLGIALAGLVVLSLGHRLLPRGRRGAATMDAAFTLDRYTTEARVPEASPAAGATVAELAAMGDGEVGVATIIRDRFRRDAPPGDAKLREGDILLLEGAPEDLERLVAKAKLTLEGEGTVPAPDEGEEVAVMEGVVTTGSGLIARTATAVALRQRHGVSLLAVSRAGQRITERLGEVRLRAGDVLVLKGRAAALPDALGSLRVLPLAERAIALGRSRRGLLPPLVLGASMVALAFHLAPVAVVFFAAAVSLLAFRVMTMREAYEAIEWPVLVLLAALIPVSEAVRTTGGTELIAGWLSHAVSSLPSLGALALMMIAAMAVTPFLNNAATVLMMAPIGAGLATKLGLSPDPFLMAVAVGSACDFLTPIGHQCNTLVMGPGGYRFGDYWRLGLPLSVLVIVVGVPLIALVWPLGGS